MHWAENRILKAVYHEGNHKMAAFSIFRAYPIWLISGMELASSDTIAVSYMYGVIVHAIILFSVGAT